MSVLYAEQQARDRINAYNTFVSRVEELNLHEVVNANPILNVRECVYSVYSAFRH